jgi:hypothetical protein
MSVSGRAPDFILILIVIIIFTNTLGMCKPLKILCNKILMVLAFTGSLLFS